LAGDVVGGLSDVGVDLPPWVTVGVVVGVGVTVSVRWP